MIKNKEEDEFQQEKGNNSSFENKDTPIIHEYAEKSKSKGTHLSENHVKRKVFITLKQIHLENIRTIDSA